MTIIKKQIEKRLRQLFLSTAFLKQEIEMPKWNVRDEWCGCFFKQYVVSIFRYNSDNFLVGDNWSGGIYNRVEKANYAVFSCEKCGNRIMADAGNNYFSSDFLRKLYPDLNKGKFQLIMKPETT